MTTPAMPINDVEAWNDGFARAHDIDEYYARANPLIRWVESRRLAAIRTLLDALPQHRILEVGCGGGHVLQMFPQNDLVGVDVSGEMIRRAERNLKGFRVTLHKGELADLHLPAGSFGRIICTEVLEHVVDPAGLLREMARLLSPEGRAVITLPNDALINGIKNLIVRSGLSRLPMFRRISWGGDQYHLHVWTPREMKALLSRHFTIARSRRIPSLLLPIRSCFLCTRDAAHHHDRSH